MRVPQGAGQPTAPERAVRDEADSELAPFKSRMTDDAYERSKAAFVDRIIRERGRFPTLSFD